MRNQGIRLYCLAIYSSYDSKRARRARVLAGATGFVNDDHELRFMNHFSRFTNHISLLLL
jgi:hypothetical protein